METLKRARALHMSGNEISLPNCDRIGDYEPVQCDPLTGNCFCVDESGFEMAGTRARSLDLVNCTSKSPDFHTYSARLRSFFTRASLYHVALTQREILPQHYLITKTRFLLS